jgi:hypothetical protein
MRSAHSGDTRSPARCRVRVEWEVFSLIRSLPASLSANDTPSLFECFIDTMPQSDSSDAYMRAVRPKSSPADLLSVLTAEGVCLELKKATVTGHVGKILALCGQIRVTVPSWFGLPRLSILGGRLDLPSRYNSYQF